MLNSLLAFSCALPTPYPSYILGLWVIVSLWQSRGHYCQNIKATIASRASLPLLLLLALQLFSFLSATYAAEPGLVWHAMLNAKVPLWLVPLTFLLCRPRVDAPRAARWFVAGAVVHVAWLFLAVALKLWRADMPEVLAAAGFEKMTLAFNSLYNRAYSGAIISIALLLIVYLWRTAPPAPRHKALYGAVAVFFATFLYFNMSRIAILAVVLTLVASVVFFVRQKRVVVGILGALALFAAVVLGTNNRLSHSEWGSAQHTAVAGASLEGFDPRVTVWKSALAVAPNRLFSGLGENNCHKPLVQEYRNRRFWYGVCAELGPHNQYLAYYIELGIVPLLLFLALVGSVPFVVAPRRRVLAFQLACYFGLFFFTECVVQRAAGAYLFSVLLFLFVAAPPAGEEVEAGRVAVAGPLAAVVARLRALGARLRPAALPAALCAMVAAVAAFVGVALWQMHSPRVVASALTRKGRHTTVEDGLPTFRMQAGALAYLEGDLAFGCPLFLASNSPESVDVVLNCFVSYDFSGNGVLAYCTPLQQQVLASASYDLSHRGTWQTLKLTLPPGRVFAHLYVGSSSNPLTGHVLWRLMSPPPQ